jgi:hypothetical protein
LTTAAAVSFQVPPLLIVTLPVYVLAPLVLLFAWVPLTVVVPATEKLNPPTVKVVPVPISRLPPMVTLVAMEALVVPLIVRFPLIVETFVNVFVELPDKVRLLYTTALTVCAAP